MKTAIEIAIEQVGTLEISNDHLAKVRALLNGLLEVEREQIEQAFSDGCMSKTMGYKQYYTTTFKNKGV